MDGFTTRQTDSQNITNTYARTYKVGGILLIRTDARGNTTSTETDIAGRTVKITDAAGNVQTIAYDPATGQPSVLTDALGKQTCYAYDQRGRKTAEWGTNIQPAVYGYNDADQLVKLTTYRASAGDITTNPTGRTDGDVTTWKYDAATGLELRKTYADGTHTDKAYDSLRRSFVDWSWCAFRPAYGFPLLCEVFSQRLVFASTVAQPQSVWMSRTDDLDRFDLGKEDDAGIAVTLATTSQNAICWLMAHGERLLLGTADAEYVVGAGQSGAVTHANVRAGNHGYVGSAPLPAVMAVDKVLYCERGGARLYQYGYDFQSDAYVSRDLTVFASHVLAQGGGVVCGAMLRKPEARAVFVLRDGSMALMTYNSMHEVHCWHRYETEGRVVSVAALPNGTRGDVLFLVVERYEEDGVVKRWIEVMREDGPWMDHGERDYVSEVVTNALTAPDVRAQKVPVAQVQMFLEEECPAEGVEVTADGTVWVKLDRYGMLPRGWNALLASSRWDWECVVGLRVRGERGFALLALQG